MRVKSVYAAVAASITLLIAFAPAIRGEEPLRSSNDRSETSFSGSSVSRPPAALLAIPIIVAIPQPKPATPDPCNSPEIVASPSRPVWDAGAATTQCGNLETDYGWQFQPMGVGVHQQILATSLRYGLTPRMDLRWGVANRIVQSGGGLPTREGAGDQSVGTTYRFHEQGARSAAMAFSYSVKVPMANPAKGFSSGFTDHSFLLVASRDLGKYHIDSNVMGILAGGPKGFEQATMAGLALNHPATARLNVILETCGGSQPGTSNRIGTGLLGATYAFRPNLVFDTAFAHTYTGGSPRNQFLVGLTYSRRSGIPSLPRGNAVARLLGR